MPSQCSCKRGGGGDADLEGKEMGDGAATGVMWPQTRGYQDSPQSQRGRELTLSDGPQKAWPLGSSILLALGLGSLVWEGIHLCVKPPVWGNWF